MAACPLPTTALYQKISKRFTREETNLLVAFLDSPGFIEFYGPEEPIVREDYTLMNPNGEVLRLDELAKKLTSAAAGVNRTLQRNVRIDGIVRANRSFSSGIERLFKTVVSGDKINIAQLKAELLKRGKEELNEFALPFLSAIESSEVLNNIMVQRGVSKDTSLAAAYVSSLESIMVMPDTIKTEEQLLDALVHELVHAFTLSPFNKAGLLLKKDPEHITAEDIKNSEAVKAGLDKKELSYLLNVLEAFEQATSRFNADSFYGLKSPVEFVAELLSNKRFLTFIQQNERSIFQKVLDSILRLLGLRKAMDANDFAFQLIEHAEREARLEKRVRSTLTTSDGIATIYGSRLKDDPNFKSVRLTVDGENYTDAAGRLYARLTSWVKETFSNNQQSFEERMKARALSDFKKEGLSTQDQLILNAGTPLEKRFTFDEWVKTKIEQDKAGAARGSYIHLMVEKAIKKMLKMDVTTTERKMKELADEFDINPNSVSWATENNRLLRVFDYLGINFHKTLADEAARDGVETEIEIVSKYLGLGTTLDMLVSHSNGDYSILDWKTGTGFFIDELNPISIKYALDETDTPDSRLTKARLELVLRAVMIKEAQPEARFRDLAVIHMSKYQDSRILKADFETYLPVIEAYVKKEKPEIYQEMKDKALFSPEAYKGKSKSTLTFESSHTKFSPEEKTKHEQLVLMDITMQSDLTRTSNDNANKLKALEATKSIVETTLGRSLKTEDKDMSTLSLWLGNIYSAKHDLVKGFGNFFLSAKQKARQELDKIFQTEETLLKAVLDDYYRRHPGKKFADNYLFWGGMEYQEVFGFMMEEKGPKEGKDVTGKYMRVITQEDVDQGRFTQAQYDYNKFQRETMQQWYDKTMTSPMATFNGITRARYEGLPDKISDDFMPRMFPSTTEIRSRHGIFSKQHGSALVRRNLTSFLENEYLQMGNKASIPLKYMGSDSMIEAGNYTLNSQISYRMFMTNLVMKHYLDPAEALGQGVKAVLDYEGEKSFADPDHYKKTKQFVENLINMHIKNVDNPNGLVAKPFTIAGKTINISKILDLLKSWTSSISMWLNVPAGLANMVLINMLNIKTAIEGSLGNSDVTGFGLKDLQFGYKQWLSWQAAQMTGKPNKLENIAKALNYMPNNYDYAAHSSKMLTTKYKLWDPSKLYIFHSIGEDMGQLTLLAAMLNHQKHPKTGQSLWDCYDENGVWKPNQPTRGVTSNGVPITELTIEEIIFMKRVSQKIHGGYRDDERTALEIGAMGRWLLMFKKYLPSILEKNFKSYYEDNSSGYWEARVPITPDALFDKDGNPVYKEVDGVKETIYDWRARAQEGRVKILLNMLAVWTNYKNNPRYDWKTMAPEQKQEVYSVMTAFLFWSAIMVLSAAGFDDDDEDTAFYLRVNRLAEDMTQGLNVMDFLKSIDITALPVKKLIALVSSTYTFLADGVVRGERTTSGRIPGEVGLIKSIPILNSVYGYERFFLYDEGGVFYRPR